MIVRALSLLLAVLLLSCSVQKRRYMRGVCVSHAVNNKTSTRSTPAARKLPASYENTAMIASAAKPSSADLFSPKIATVIASPLKMPPDSCDMIELRTGEPISAHVFEISTEMVKYYPCDNANRVVHSLYRADVYSVRYANGTEERFVKPAAKPVTTPSTEQIVHPAAKTAFALGIASLACLIIYPLVLPAAIATFIFSASAIRAIDRDPQHYTGKKKAKQGRMMAAIALGVILSIVAIVILALAIAL